MMQASLHGRLGKDPRAIQTRTGNSMATCSIAVTIPASREGEDPGTVWFDVLAFGRIAEQLLRQAKGEMVNLAGEVRLNRWTKDGGEVVETQQIIAESIISARSTRPAGNRQGRSNTRHTASQRAQAPAFDDELNF